MSSAIPMTHTPPEDIFVAEHLNSFNENEPSNIPVEQDCEFLGNIQEDSVSTFALVFQQNLESAVDEMKCNISHAIDSNADSNRDSLNDLPRKKVGNEKKSSNNRNFGKRGNPTLDLLEENQNSVNEFQREIVQLKRAKLKLEAEELSLKKAKFAIWEETEKQKLIHIASIDKSLRILATNHQNEK